MADFRQALQYVLTNEGLWSNHPLDRGGATMWGITLKLASKYGFDTPDKLRNIDAKDRDFIYRAEFWKFDGLDSHAVATKVFDIAVNSGLRIGIIALQKAISKHSLISVDGNYGPITEKSANAIDPDSLVTLLCEYQRARYLAIVEHSADQRVFLSGWLKRAERRPE